MLLSTDWLVWIDRFFVDQRDRISNEHSKPKHDWFQFQLHEENLVEQLQIPETESGEKQWHITSFTIRPSPLPRSIKWSRGLLEYCFNKWKILSNWIRVAGTYGSAWRRNAGVKNGTASTVRPDTIIQLRMNIERFSTCQDRFLHKHRAKCDRLFSNLTLA